MGKLKTAKQRARLATAARLDQLYRTLPRIECKELCQVSCGPIGMTTAEWQRIKDRTGAEPACDAELNCSLLRAGRCAAYAVRPAVCRLFGVVADMACPFGCVPERWLTTEEGHRFLSAVDEAGGRRGSRVTLPPAITTTESGGGADTLARLVKLMQGEEQADAKIK